MQTSEAKPFADRPSQMPHEASLQACFWCQTPHPAKHPLSVCPGCVTAARAGGFPMGSLEMSGSYPLTSKAIDERLTHKSAGNYALGYMDGDTFMVFYVGRSDSDLRHRLHEWVGAPSHEVDSSYTRFAYSYAPSAEAAFAKEWRNYDDFGGSVRLDNATPPSRRQAAPQEYLEQRA